MEDTQNNTENFTVQPEDDEAQALTPEEQAERDKQELQILKGRADMLGIKYSNNIGLATLKAKIEEKTSAADEIRDAASEDTQTTAPPVQDAEQVNALTAALAEDDPSKIDFSTWSKKDREAYCREYGRREALKLIRLRVACMDPKKKDIPGEIITTGNRYIGTVRKFIPFGEFTDEGYHVPNCIYQVLKARKFLQITTKRDRHTGTNRTTTRWVPEFSLEVLPPLTEDELSRLAMEQQASGRIQDNSL